LRPNLERGEGRKFAAISSLAASIASYPIAGHYAYRASKAALNSLWRSLAMEWRTAGLIGLLLRPGKVRTRMTGFTGDLEPTDSVRGMRAVIARAGLDDAGRFFGYDGREVPW
ncbi:MAG: SDR family NAD(P)-dependent oxidoreductase, partial [Alphaproteobacteria bacterium]|nr:SDR family NAD(P)-dependent oxidoreductase [Alphaproteobacteria bacterium]